MNIARTVLGSSAALAGIPSLAVAACDSYATGADGDVIQADALEVHRGQNIVLLTMRITPDARMNALFEGRVVQDDAGCLRLASPDPATVVWPKGYGFIQTVEGFAIVDEDGTEIGRVGSEFALGGGEVDELLEALGFTEADRALAEEHCPGKFWIATPQ